MASNDFSDSIEFNAIPFIDLRVLSRSDLHSLSLSDNISNRSHLDEIIIPKTIDKSVFNESAASRKQTYSRFRLAPPTRSSYSNHPTRNDRVILENPEVSEALRELFDEVVKSEIVDDRVKNRNEVEELLLRSDEDEQLQNVVVGAVNSDVAGRIKGD